MYKIGKTNFGNDWDGVLCSDEMELCAMSIDKSLMQINEPIYPDRADLFRAIELTSFKDTKVVVLGQDPYHEPNQAMGLAFSVPLGTKMPPSLRNIFKELDSDLGIKNVSTDLTNWAKQGVLLLNTVLTVTKGQANSHKDFGWQKYTDNIIRAIASKSQPVVFILWGANAWKKKKLISGDQHLIIESAHPSPLSSYRGFFGSKPFSRCNEFLKSNGQAEIDWQT